MEGVWTEGVLYCSEAVRAFRKGVAKTPKITGLRSLKNEMKISHERQIGFQVCSQNTRRRYGTND
jgi:hypothetical protein